MHPRRPFTCGRGTGKYRLALANAMTLHVAYVRCSLCDAEAFVTDREFGPNLVQVAGVRCRMTAGCSGRLEHLQVPMEGLPFPAQPVPGPRYDWAHPV